MPVYGLWEEGCFWFGTGLASVKGRNIAAEMEVDDPVSGAALYRVRPKVVLAWLEGAFPQTRSRWELG